MRTCTHFHANWLQLVAVGVQLLAAGCMAWWMPPTMHCTLFCITSLHGCVWVWLGGMLTCMHFVHPQQPDWPLAASYGPSCWPLWVACIMTCMHGLMHACHDANAACCSFLPGSLGQLHLRATVVTRCCCNDACIHPRRLVLKWVLHAHYCKQDVVACLCALEAVEREWVAHRRRRWQRGGR